MNLKKAIAGVCLGVLLLTGGCGQNQSNTQQKQDTTEQNTTQAQEALWHRQKHRQRMAMPEGQSQAEASRDIFAMDTYMSVIRHSGKTRASRGMRRRRRSSG